MEHLGGAVFLLGVLFWFLQYLASGTLERNAKIVGMVASAAGPVIAAATLGFNILQQRHARATEAADDTERRNRAAEMLADAVRLQWEEEAKVRKLHGRAPLRLHWLTTDRPVTPAAATILGDAVAGGRVTKVRFHGHSEEVGEKFAALPHRRLVILGKPGAGKTVLAMLLVLDLLGHRRPGDPVPVLLSVSSWDPTKEHLHRWMTHRLLEDYLGLGNAAVYGPAAAQQLVVSGRILAILDGLDEMPSGLRATAMGELDRAHADRPLVLTCRSEEYEEAVAVSGELLAAAAVVEIQPVTVEEAISFLQRAIASTDTRWEEVFSHLRVNPDGALAAALSSPLMVALTRTIYTAPDREPRTLVAIATDNGQATVERHLLDNLIPAVYTDRPSAPGLHASSVRRRWDPESARCYLGFLARHLRERDTRELAWWELHVALPRIVRLVVGLLAGLLAGLVVGLQPGLLQAGLQAGVLTGVLTGVLVGLVFVFGLVFGTAPSPARMQFRVRGRIGELARIVRLPLAVFGVVGLVAGFLFWLMGWVAGGLLLWLAVGLGFGLLIGPTGGLLEWLGKPADYTLAVNPESVFKGDRSWAAIICLWTWLISVLVVVLVALLLAGRGLVLGLVLGLVFGLLAGLGFGLATTAWGWFVTTRSWLAFRHQLPRQLMTFLDDAYHRGVLRQTGATYQFRHARLQEHLAAQPTTRRGPADIHSRVLRS